MGKVKPTFFDKSSLFTLQSRLTLIIMVDKSPNWFEDPISN